MASARPAERDADSKGPVILGRDFKLAWARFHAHAMNHHAAALTYYSLLALLPALLLLVAILGVVGEQRLIDQAASYLREVHAPRETVNAVTAALDASLASDRSALSALAIGVVASLLGASSAFGAVGTALNAVLDLQEGRSVLRRKANDLAISAVLLLLVLMAFLLVFLGGRLASLTFGLMGLGETAADAWRILRWPGAVGCALLVYAITFSTAPHIPERRFRWITPGALVGLLAWAVASALFFAFADGVASYSAVYGTFSAIVMLLIWLWLTNAALLYGAELNAVVDDRRGGPDSRVEIRRALRRAAARRRSGRRDRA